MSDTDLLNIDLKSMIKWAGDNKMQLNKLKFQLLHHGSKIPYNVDGNTSINKSTKSPKHMSHHKYKLIVFVQIQTICICTNTNIYF